MSGRATTTSAPTFGRAQHEVVERQIDEAARKGGLVGVLEADLHGAAAHLRRVLRHLLFALLVRLGFVERLAQQQQMSLLDDVSELAKVRRRLLCRAQKR